MSENAESSLAEVKKWLGIKKLDTENDLAALQEIMRRIEDKIGKDKVAAHIKEHFCLNSVDDLARERNAPMLLSVTISRLKKEYA